MRLDPTQPNRTVEPNGQRITQRTMTPTGVDPAAPELVPELVTDGSNPELQRTATEDVAAVAVDTQRARDVRIADKAWQDLKSRFVDDPAGALVEAEDRVREAVERRVRALHAEAEALCAHDRDAPDDGGDSTEALRHRLLRYQEYCQRLAEPAVVH
jgi:hypothetical protein